MKILLELAFIFLRIGLFTFGGGYAMLPLLQAELVDKKKWITQEQLMDYFCIGQSTPGIIAVNVATFVGYNRAKIVGAIVATLALVTAPVVVILSLAKILVLYKDNQYVVSAFVGIRIVVTALIADAVIKLWKNAIKDYEAIVVFVVSLIAAVWLNVSPVVMVGCGLGLSLLANLRRLKK